MEATEKKFTGRGVLVIETLKRVEPSLDRVIFGACDCNKKHWKWIDWVDMKKGLKRGDYDLSHCGERKTLYNTLKKFSNYGFVYSKQTPDSPVFEEYCEGFQVLLDTILCGNE